MPHTVQTAFTAKPAWVKREVDKNELGVITDLIRESCATSAAEIGVASGFSSAMIYAALSENTPSPRLHAFDLSTQCYYDDTRKTGDAFFEIHGLETKGYHLTTGVTSATLAPFEAVDFLFIDANHCSPWPALDVLSMGRYLKPGGSIGLDDIEMIFLRGWIGKNRNGARDLYRVWRGEKARHAGSTSLGILKNVNVDQITHSVGNALRIDWDEALPDEAIEHYKEISRHYGASGKTIATLLERHRKSYRGVRVTKPSTAQTWPT